jgi:hypothetical protein
MDKQNRLVMLISTWLLDSGTHANENVRAIILRAGIGRCHVWHGEWVQTSWASSLRTKINNEIGSIVRLTIMVNSIQNTFAGFVGIFVLG